MFTYFVCLFCSHVVVSIMEFDATVVHVRGLASCNTRFNPPFYIGKWLYKVRNMTAVIYLFDVFALLILLFECGLSVLNLPRSSVFYVILLFPTFININMIKLYINRLRCRWIIILLSCMIRLSSQARHLWWV